MSISGASLLHLVCIGGSVDTVQFLLGKQLDVNQYDYNQETPLYQTCKRGFFNNFIIVELLLKNNVDVSLCNLEGNSPLHVACLKGFTDKVKIVLQLI